MKFLNLLHRKKEHPEETRLFFSFADINSVHSNDISKEVHTKKKYYYKVFCKDLAYCVGNNAWDHQCFDNSNIAIFIAPSYIGVSAEPFDKVILRRQKDFSEGRYPLFYVDEKSFAIYLSDVVKHCTDIHAELDHKDGKCMTKYIFHCADNENDFDIYLVMYSDSVNMETKTYLLNPDWIQ